MPGILVIGGIICAAAALAFILTRPRLIQWSAGNSSAESVAISRILIATAALLFVLFAPLSSITVITDTPQHSSFLFNSAGILDPLLEQPWFLELLTNETYLILFKTVTIVSLLLVVIGYRTRLFLITSFLLFFLYLGVLHHTFGFFHKGMLPLHLLAVLIFTPCADAFSVDAKKKRRTRSAYRYQATQFLIWLLIALAYLAAGISKLKNTGLAWMEADNVRGWLHISEQLDPSSWLYGLSLRFVELPDIGLLSAGIGLVVFQLLFPLVLFFRPARAVFPVLAVMMHVTIYLFFGFLFFDMMLIQLVFYLPFLVTLQRAHKDNSEQVTEQSRTSVRLHISVLALLILLHFSLGLYLNARYFPFTAWPVYSGESHYGAGHAFTRPRVFQEHEDGTVVETSFSALQEKLDLYYFPYQMCYNTIHPYSGTFESYGECSIFLSNVGERLNNKYYPENPISVFEVQIWEWSLNDLRSKNHLEQGELLGTHRFEVI